MSSPAKPWPRPQVSTAQARPHVKLGSSKVFTPRHSVQVSSPSPSSSSYSPSPTATPSVGRTSSVLPPLGTRLVVSDTAAIGTVRFAGTTFFASGTWVGVCLDEPLGKNDGSVQGQRYFSCEPGYGLFVRPEALCLIDTLDEEDSDDVPLQRGGADQFLTPESRHVRNPSSASTASPPFASPLSLAAVDDRSEAKSIEDVQDELYCAQPPGESEISAACRLARELACSVQTHGGNGISRPGAAFTADVRQQGKDEDTIRLKDEEIARLRARLKEETEQRQCMQDALSGTWGSLLRAQRLIKQQRQELEWLRGQNRPVKEPATLPALNISVRESRIRALDKGDLESYQMLTPRAIETVESDDVVEAAEDQRQKQKIDTPEEKLLTARAELSEEGKALAAELPVKGDQQAVESGGAVEQPEDKQRPRLETGTTETPAIAYAALGQRSTKEDKQRPRLKTGTTETLAIAYAALGQRMNTARVESVEQPDNTQRPRLRSGTTETLAMLYAGAAEHARKTQEALAEADQHVQMFQEENPEEQPRRRRSRPRALDEQAREAAEHPQAPVEPLLEDPMSASRDVGQDPVIEHDSAAVRIQANVRGHLCRQRLSKEDRGDVEYDACCAQGTPDDASGREKAEMGVFCLEGDAPLADPFRCRHRAGHSPCRNTPRSPDIACLDKSATSDLLLAKAAPPAPRAVNNERRASTDALSTASTGDWPEFTFSGGEDDDSDLGSRGSGSRQAPQRGGGFARPVLPQDEDARAQQRAHAKKVEAAGWKFADRITQLEAELYERERRVEELESKHNATLEQMSQLQRGAQTRAGAEAVETQRSRRLQEEALEEASKGLKSVADARAQIQELDRLIARLRAATPASAVRTTSAHSPSLEAARAAEGCVSPPRRAKTQYSDPLPTFNLGDDCQGPSAAEGTGSPGGRLRERRMAKERLKERRTAPQRPSRGQSTAAAAALANDDFTITGSDDGDDASPGPSSARRPREAKARISQNDVSDDRARATCASARNDMMELEKTLSMLRSAVQSRAGPISQPSTCLAAGAVSGGASEQRSEPPPRAEEIHPASQQPEAEAMGPSVTDELEMAHPSMAQMGNTLGEVKELQIACFQQLQQLETKLQEQGPNKVPLGSPREGTPVHQRRPVEEVAQERQPEPVPLEQSAKALQFIADVMVWHRLSQTDPSSSEATPRTQEYTPRTPRAQEYTPRGQERLAAGVAQERPAEAQDLDRSDEEAALLSQLHAQPWGPGADPAVRSDPAVDVARGRSPRSLGLEVREQGDIARAEHVEAEDDQHDVTSEVVADAVDALPGRPGAAGSHEQLQRTNTSVAIRHARTAPRQRTFRARSPTAEPLQASDKQPTAHERELSPTSGAGPSSPRPARTRRQRGVTDPARPAGQQRDPRVRAQTAAPVFLLNDLGSPSLEQTIMEDEALETEAAAPSSAPSELARKPGESEEAVAANIVEASSGDDNPNAANTKAGKAQESAVEKIQSAVRHHGQASSGKVDRRERDQAAVTIQKNVRGYQSRGRTKVLRQRRVQRAISSQKAFSSSTVSRSLSRGTGKKEIAKSSSKVAGIEEGANDAGEQEPARDNQDVDTTYATRTPAPGTDAPGLDEDNAMDLTKMMSWREETPEPASAAESARAVRWSGDAGAAEASREDTSPNAVNAKAFSEDKNPNVANAEALNQKESQEPKPVATESKRDEELREWLKNNRRTSMHLARGGDEDEDPRNDDDADRLMTERRTSNAEKRGSCVELDLTAGWDSD